RRITGHSNAILVHLLREPLREPLQGRFGSPVERAAVAGRFIGAAPRPNGTPRGEINDAAAAPRDHVWQNQLAEPERTMHIHRKDALPAVGGEVQDRYEVAQGRI